MLMSGQDYRESLRRYHPQVLHGGGSPEAMKRAIWRQYPVADQTALVERLLERGLLTAETGPKLRRQPGRCCAMGCQVPAAPPAAGSTFIPN